ncbi:DNA cytosine methyltransferase [Anaerotruncus sp. 1XD22-93]|nr:DNA cytosine methyltransferase [Lachnospiraceae bacterium]NBI74087.1 DNA cytosine methyltransferase [Lachnospiraceae bacterium]RKK00204.1 DNA cytosine methyltransferase [Anaerotruncus sp. 1XD22-93]
MTSLDIFSGAGGMTLGFKLAGIKSIGAIEIDRFAAETFKFNFPEIPLYARDVYSFSDEEIQDLFSGVDIIAGGPPCQGFSVAGPTQYGIIDKRNTLIMEFFRFIKVLRPKFCVLENVKGILSGKMNSSQKAMNVYIEALSNIGYISKVYVLQAADFGVPQFRERVVVISVQNETLLPENIVGDYMGEENWIKVEEVFGDLPEIHAGEGVNEFVPYPCEPKSAYQEYLRIGSKGVANHVAMKHTQRLIERFASIPQGGSLLDAPSELGQRQRNGNELDVKKRYKTNNQRLHPNRVSFIVTASFQSTFVHPYLNRNLTAREGARLQSFPDYFVFCGPRTLMSKSLLIRENRLDEIGLSQYNQIGNAVPPRMAEGIAKAIMRKEEQE